MCFMCIHMAFVKTPYTNTSSVHCVYLVIPVATEPRDAEVEWTIESTSAIVHINWSMPLVVNGEIAWYRIFAMRLIPEADDVPVFHTVSRLGLENELYKR